MRCQVARSAKAGAASAPSLTTPRSGLIRPVRIVTKVDFPAPLRPTRPWHSPAPTSSDTSRSAWVSPKAFQTPCATPTEGRTAANPPFTGSDPPFTSSITLPSAILSGSGLRVAPKVGVVDVVLVHHGRRQRVLKVALQGDDR